MSLVSLGVQGFFNKELSHGSDRHHYFSHFLSKRLKGISKTLDENGLYFEASSAEEIAKTFSTAANSKSEDDFAMAWNELEDWCGQRVDWKGKNRVLCKIPHLPDRFSC